LGKTHFQLHGIATLIVENLNSPGPIFQRSVITQALSCSDPRCPREIFVPSEFQLVAQAYRLGCEGFHDHSSAQADEPSTGATTKDRIQTRRIDNSGS
jgi:hypothetical protein